MSWISPDVDVYPELGCPHHLHLRACQLFYLARIKDPDGNPVVLVSTRQS